MTLNFLRKTSSTYLEIIIFNNLNYKDQTCQNIFGTKFQNPTLNDEIFLSPDTSSWKPDFWELNFLEGSGNYTGMHVCMIFEYI